MEKTADNQAEFERISTVNQTDKSKIEAKNLAKEKEFRKKINSLDLDKQRYKKKKEALEKQLQ